MLHKTQSDIVIFFSCVFVIFLFFSYFFFLSFLFSGLTVRASRPPIPSSSKTADKSCHYRRGLARGVQGEGRRERSGSWRVGAVAVDPEPPIS